MKTITPTMQRMLEAQTATLATGWLIARVDGQVFAFTDHDRDVTFNLEAIVEAWGYVNIPGLVGTGERTYESFPGYVQTDVENSSGLNVDNMEVHGLLNSPSITLDDLRAGLWDYATVFIFYFNWAERLQSAGTITSLTRISANAIATTSVAHNLSDGDMVEIAGATPSAYNGLFEVDVTSPTHFQYVVSGAPTTPATGAITFNARYGPVMLRVGKIGECTVEGGTFTAELRGLTQYYTRTIGEIVSPSCRADLGDSRCQVDLVGGSPSFTVTGEILSTSDDGLVLYDPARTEPGPADGVAITGISNAQPGVVTLASPVTFVEHEPVTISGVVGMPLLNTTVQVDNPSGSTFQLSVDTSDTLVWGTYSSGGTVYPLGATSGYFDGGKITILTGRNAGHSTEVKSYVPGQITLWLPFPYAIETGSPSTLYSMHVGCDKSLTTCRDRFNNVVNFRGEPYLPGIDKLVQVGRQT